MDDTIQDAEVVEVVEATETVVETPVETPVVEATQAPVEATPEQAADAS